MHDPDNFWDSTEQEKKLEEVLEFKVNPMLAMYFKTLQGNKDTKYALNFSEVFYEKKLCKVSKQMAGKYTRHIEEVCTHFVEDLAIQKLHGERLSDWQSELGVFLKMCENNVCKRKHLAMFVKLPFFYKEEQEFQILTESFEGVVDEDDFDYKVMHTSLKPVTAIKRYSRLAKQKDYIYLTDKKGHMYEYCNSKNNTTKSIIFNVWKDFQPVEIIARVKSRTNIAKKWYYTENFTIKST